MQEAVDAGIVVAARDMNAAGKPASLWAVTSYFNPSRYRRRLRNYHAFRRHLGVPLLTVEWSLEGRFELEEGDADILVRVDGGDLMWQKERLLDIGIGRLPASCTSVACLDCDILFGRADWGERAEALLDRFPMAQPFGRVNYLRADHPEVTSVADPLLLLGATEASLPSLAALAAGEPGRAFVPDYGFHGRGNVANGFAWVFRRELLLRHGLYAACIIGGGDTALACAAWNLPQLAVQRHAMNRAQERYYLDWAHAFGADVGGQVGYAEGDIFHLWHGHLEDRRAHKRHLGLGEFGFDPGADVALDSGGCWRWNSNKPGLHEYLRNYFPARREDG